MTEFENIDILLAKDRPKPTIKFLVLEDYVNSVKEQITSLSEQTKIHRFIAIEIRRAEIEKNPDVWLDFALVIDCTALASAMGVVSATITIGTFLYKTFKFLRRFRAKKQIKKLKMNCTASVALAIDHLRSVGAQVRPNQIKLVYLSGMLAYYCLAIFASPIRNPKELHVIATHIDGKISSYNLVAL